MVIRRSSFLVSGAVATSLLALQFSNLWGGRPIKLAAAVALAGLIAMLPAPRLGQFSGRTAAACITYALSLVAAIVFGVWNGGESLSAAFGDSLVIFLAFALGLRWVPSAPTPEDLGHRLAIVALIPGIYVAANVALHFALPFLPIEPPEANSIAAGLPAGLLQLLGVEATRVQFPLTKSINNFAVVAGAGLASATVLFVQARSIPRTVSGGLIAFCVVALLMSDARLPAAVSVVVALALSLPRGSRLARPALAFGLVAPLLLVNLLPVVGSALGVISRGSQDLTTLNGRIPIWRGVEQVLARPAPDQLFGYGIGGQRTSGASTYYASLFDVEAEVALATHAHNAALQTVLEIGYFGLVAFVLAAWFSVGTLARVSSRYECREATAVLAALLTVLVCGATEATPTLVSTEALFFALVVFGACTTLARSDGLRTAG